MEHSSEDAITDAASPGHTQQCPLDSQCCQCHWTLGVSSRFKARGVNFWLAKSVSFNYTPLASIIQDSISHWYTKEISPESKKNLYTLSSKRSLSYIFWHNEPWKFQSQERSVLIDSWAMKDWSGAVHLFTTRLPTVFQTSPLTSSALHSINGLQVGLKRSCRWEPNILQFDSNDIINPKNMNQVKQHESWYRAEHEDDCENFCKPASFWRVLGFRGWRGLIDSKLIMILKEKEWNVKNKLKLFLMSEIKLSSI